MMVLVGLGLVSLTEVICMSVIEGKFAGTDNTLFERAHQGHRKMGRLQMMDIKVSLEV